MGFVFWFAFVASLFQPSRAVSMAGLQIQSWLMLRVSRLRWRYVGKESVLPQALQMISPLGPLLHNGVDVVAQFAHLLPVFDAAAAA